MFFPLTLYMSLVHFNLTFLVKYFVCGGEQRFDQQVCKLYALSDQTLIPKSRNVISKLISFLEASLTLDYEEFYFWLSHCVDDWLVE